MTILKRQDNQERRASILYNLSALAEAQGYYEEAVQYSREALILMPNSAYMHRRQGQVLIYVRRLEEAESALAQAVALDEHENSPYLWYHRAQIAIARGDGLRADQMLDEAVKRDASFDVALQQAQAAWLQGRIKAAQETFKQVWENANLGERLAIHREMERLFDDHPELAGRDALHSMMKKGDD